MYSLAYQSKSTHLKKNFRKLNHLVTKRDRYRDLTTILMTLT